MSFPGGKIPDHMTDTDVERRIQEEIRIRQQNKNILNASRAYAGPTPGPPSAADHAFMNLMAAEGNGAGAYYGVAAAAAHQRAAYGGLGQQAAAFGMDNIYARQQQQQQQHAHAAAAAAYGYAPRAGTAGHYAAAAAYGHHAATASDIYSQHIAMTNMEQRAAAYGSVTQQQQTEAHRQLLAAASPPPKLAPSSNSSVITSPAGTTVPSAESTPLPAHLQGSPSISNIAPKSSPTSLSGMGAPSTPMSTMSSVIPSPRTTSTKKKNKPKKEPHETTELEDLKIDKWYSGCVPLGLDDDKYWLSELQVYLRANFGKRSTTKDSFILPVGLSET